jgi:uncharacterized Zn finger protein
MFIKSVSPYIVKGTQSVSIKCPNCHNTTDHVVVIIPKKLNVSFVFGKKPLAGKRYMMACPTCGHLTKEITKEQYKALQV